MGFGEKIYKRKNADKAAFYSSNGDRENKEMIMAPAPPSKSPEEREFVVDSGASTHMMNKKKIQMNWRLCADHSQKPKTKIKRGMAVEIRTTLLEEFTDNLEDTELHAPAHTSQDSDSERATKVVSKSSKHSIYTHFPKDLRSLLANQNDKGSLQKTHWRSSTSSRKVW